MNGFTAFTLQFRCKLRLSCYYAYLNSKPANRFPAQPKVLAPVINLEPPRDGIVHISYQATSTVCKMLLSLYDTVHPILWAHAIHRK
jgi:hypothetical protein